MKQISIKEFIDNPEIASKLTTPQLAHLLAEMRSITAGLTLSKRAPDTVAATAEMYSRGKWKRAPHLYLLSEWLGDLARGEKRRLLVSMPPRHGKSETISYWFPLWFLSHNPDKNVILCSYEADFAAHWGRRCRNAILDFGADIGLELDETSKAADKWLLKTGGGMMTAGAGGPITGRGAHCLIIDDPIKNSEEAQSETMREKLWEWWQTTAHTRIEPGGFCIVVATRWHQDDLIGRLERNQEDSGPPWDVLKIPAIAEDTDQIGRRPGEPLWPERYPLEKLEEIRSGISPYNWSALYQQNPSPEEGGGVRRKWWNYYHAGHPPVDMETYTQSWDLAFKDTKKSDFNVGQVWGRKGGRFYLLDQIRERASSVEVIKAVRNFSMKYPQATGKLIEDTANGPAVIATLQDEVAGIIPMKPRGSKDARLQAIIPMIESGSVHLPGKKNGNDEWIPAYQWVAEFIEEHAAFPNGTNDDQIDACTQALIYLQPGAWKSVGHAWKEAKKGPEPKTTQEIQTKEFWDRVKKKQKVEERKVNASGAVPMGGWRKSRIGRGMW